MTQQIHYFFSSPHNEQRAVLLETIESVLRHLELEPVNTLDISPGELWQSTIRRAIERADIVLIDVTGENPNVMFEAGIATALNKASIFFVQPDTSSVPWSLRRNHILIYDPDNPESLVNLSNHIRLWMQGILQTRQTWRTNA